MSWLVLIISVLYAAVLNRIVRSWNSIETISVENNEPVTVVVVFRNEEQNLPILINGLKTQSIPQSELNIIFVNDHSIDKSAQIVDDFLRNTHIQSQHISIANLGLEGKKAGVTSAVSAANTDLILSTDADCILPPTWVETMRKNAIEKSFVSGPVKFVESNSWWKKLSQLDFLSLIVLGFSSINKTRPTLANGANMMFRKSAFLQVNGYVGNEQIVGGDDVFLLEKLAIAAQPIGVCKSEEALVQTGQPQSFEEFIRQRLRWAGKTRLQLNNPRHDWLLALMVCYMFFFLVIIGALFGGWKAAILAFIVKFVADYLFFKNILPFFKERILLKKVWIASVLHPIYVVLIGVSSKFTSIQWKGRIYKK
ncbi:MAG: glycosyltransferase [Flavobacteriales bacterium]|nr:glycosyltransferase [Flavobacteriales bacterium]